MAKITGTRFIVTMAIRPDAQIDYMGSNFWFMVTDQVNQDQKALYYWGTADVPPKHPITWSITDPPIVTTPQPLGVADWGGQAVFSEKQQDGKFRTEMWISPDVLAGRTIRFGIHAHLNDPQRGFSSQHGSSAFTLREVAPGVEVPAGMPQAPGPSVLAFMPPPVNYWSA
jgi:hypothetical protein